MSVPRGWVWYLVGTIGTFVAVGVVAVAGGGAMFSPGPLSPKIAAAVPRGNVQSHAELANNCAACHSPLFRSTTMADRCLVCHDDVKNQIATHVPMHGKIPNAHACRECHTEHQTNGRLTKHGKFDHSLAAFPLTGAHLAVQCAKCHATDAHKGTPTACAACHTEPKVHLGKFGTQCAACHAADTWKGSKLGTLLGTGPPRRRLRSLEDRLPADGQTHIHRLQVVPHVRRLPRHVDELRLVPRGAEGPPRQVRRGLRGLSPDRELEGAAASPSSGARDREGAAVAFDHDKTHFKLTGKHVGVGCAACHKSGSFVGTSQSCVSCHAEPKMHAGFFGVDCIKCHATNEWKGAAVAVATTAIFDHDKTHFSLTGKHRGVVCSACHKGQTFTFAAPIATQNCTACHVEPKLHTGLFGVDCMKCHTTNEWKGAALAALTAAIVDHDKTHFKLTGKHKGVSCSGCHKGGETFAIAADKQSCFACHAEPKVHKGMLGVDCAKCHATLSWKGATFAHKFPINHGAGKKGSMNGCVTCHQNPESVAVYTCYGCHAHTKERIAQQHRGPRYTAAVLEKCAKCHPTGRERDRRGALDEASPLDRFLHPSPQLGRVDDVPIPDHAAIIRRFILTGDE